MVQKYLLFFIIFGFLGWGIDTIYRSIRLNKYSPGTLIPYFAITFGTGGAALILLFEYAQTSLLNHIILGGILVTLIELISGIISYNLLNKRLWDYSKNKYNFLGHIDLLHTFYWFIMAGILRLMLSMFPKLF
ncbi:MAG: putative ABC transporter permease [Nanoarchaeota archaeon]